MYVAKIFGYDGYIEINAFITGAVSIGVISGAYSTEVFRGAIQSINKGQFEASEVLGFKKKIYYYKIIIPQMLRLALPNISNVWQITLKRYIFNISYWISRNYENVIYCCRINKRPSVLLFFCSSIIFIFNFFEYAVI